MWKNPLAKSAPVEAIERRILLLRGQKVMLNADLAARYGVETRVLNQAVKRNIERFPGDFMFRLTREEIEFRNPSGKRPAADPAPAVSTRFHVPTDSQGGQVLRSQIAISNRQAGRP